MGVFNFLNRGYEFNKLANAIGRIKIMLQEIEPLIQNSYSPVEEYSEGIFAIAYIARKGVYERMKKYGWSMLDKISIPAIQQERILIAYAFELTIGKLNFIARELNLSEEVREILEGGPLCLKLEAMLPQSIKSQ